MSESRLSNLELTTILAMGICASSRVDFSLERHQELIVDSAIAILDRLREKTSTIWGQLEEGTGRSATE